MYKHTKTSEADSGPSIAFVVSIVEIIKVDWVLDGHALCCKLGVSNEGWCHLVANPKYHMLQQVFSTLCIY